MCFLHQDFLETDFKPSAAAECDSDNNWCNFGRFWDFFIFKVSSQEFTDRPYILEMHIHTDTHTHKDMDLCVFFLEFIAFLISQSFHEDWNYVKYVQEDKYKL